MAKLVNNTITFTTAAITAEALVAGAKAGLDPAAMLRVINHGSGKSEMSTRRFTKCVLPRKFDAGAFLPNGLKDLTLFIELARSVDARSPMAEAAAQIRRQAVELLGPKADSSEEIKLYEHWAHFELPARSMEE